MITELFWEPIANKNNELINRIHHLLPEKETYTELEDLAAVLDSTLEKINWYMTTLYDDDNWVIHILWHNRNIWTSIILYSIGTWSLPMTRDELIDKIHTLIDRVGLSQDFIWIIKTADEDSRD